MIGVIFACLGQEKGYWKSNDIIICLHCISLVTVYIIINTFHAVTYHVIFILYQKIYNNTLIVHLMSAQILCGN